MLSGDDVVAVQRALGAVPDGLYGPRTAGRARAWKWKPGGYRRSRVNGRLGSKAQRWLLGELALPGVYRRRAARRRDFEPQRPLPTPPGLVSEFLLPDPDGAPAEDGRTYHAGFDWFAPARTPVRAPVSGQLAEVARSRRRRGQVFGGAIKIESDLSGHVWVLRHMNPSEGFEQGGRVESGDVVGTVAAWRDGRPHIHLEVWKTLEGGYRIENMLDPHDLLVA